MDTKEFWLDNLLLSRASIRQPLFMPSIERRRSNLGTISRSRSAKTCCKRKLRLTLGSGQRPHARTTFLTPWEPSCERA